MGFIAIDIIKGYGIMWGTRVTNGESTKIHLTSANCLLEGNRRHNYKPLFSFQCSTRYSTQIARLH